MSEQVKSIPAPASTPVQCSLFTEQSDCEKYNPHCFWTPYHNKCLSPLDNGGCSGAPDLKACYTAFTTNCDTCGAVVPPGGKNLCKWDYINKDYMTQKCIPTCDVYQDKNNCNNAYGCKYDDTNNICKSVPTSNVSICEATGNRCCDKYTNKAEKCTGSPPQKYNYCQDPIDCPGTVAIAYATDDDKHPLYRCSCSTEDCESEKCCIHSGRKQRCIPPNVTKGSRN